MKETWYYGNTLSYSPETFGWLVRLVHTPPNMWLEHLVRVLFCGFFRSVFDISINRRQNENFLWTEILLLCRKLFCCFFLIHLTYLTFWFCMGDTDKWKLVQRKAQCCESFFGRWLFSTAKLKSRKLVV